MLCQWTAFFPHPQESCSVIVPDLRVQKYENVSETPKLFWSFFFSTRRPFQCSLTTLLCFPLLSIWDCKSKYHFFILQDFSNKIWTFLMGPYSCHSYPAGPLRCSLKAVAKVGTFSDPTNLFQYFIQKTN